MKLTRFRFTVLILLVTISGFTQGMLLPLIAILLEQNGISSTLNGLHATGLYIGVLVASPFMEKPLQRLGFKPIIAIGGILVFVSMAFFPFYQALWFWFMLRVVIGIGDHMLHFGTQTWITTASDASNRGRNISFYGLFFSLGFAIGPLMTRLVDIHPSLPFFLSSGLSVIVWGCLFFIRNEWPEQGGSVSTSTSSWYRFGQTFKYAWIAFLPPFGYGFLEATLHGNFPVYGLRIGHDVDTLSLIIPCFAAGSLLLQIPLGVLSDRYGRRRVLSIALLIGVATFFLASLLEHSVVALFFLFTVAGMFVGSIYSLGISFMTDLLPKSLLPAGNIMCGISFSIGSMIGPYIGGVFMDYVPSASFFHVVSTTLFLISLPIVISRRRELRAAQSFS
ncbi:MFS transporter [Pontibacillus halophilus JSM 076056 = DSM 19796]|uniref:MFS transporter n=1 Tax=Pontibacillus halophilus JSM 076056 = DSM 19796 TaxID=1385510 RepID=A0A0A5GIB8_9BACI|nr:MFS transporter [Pontibacillus halophilus]KGX92981.1 MFS transporter [Pontibacillus halophilus JSM 076056 = DSM 19796]